MPSPLPTREPSHSQPAPLTSPLRASSAPAPVQAQTRIGVGQLAAGVFACALLYGAGYALGRGDWRGWMGALLLPLFGLVPLLLASAGVFLFVASRRRRADWRVLARRTVAGALLALGLAGAWAAGEEGGRTRRARDRALDWDSAAQLRTDLEEAWRVEGRYPAQLQDGPGLSTSGRLLYVPGSAGGHYRIEERGAARRGGVGER